MVDCAQIELKDVFIKDNDVSNFHTPLLNIYDGLGTININKAD